MNKSTIRQILLEQDEEIKNIFAERIIPREVMQNARKMAGSSLIKVISGIRRCGKSVLAHCLLRQFQYGYVNFDDERLMGIRAEDLNDFLEVLSELKPGCRALLLDEIQNVNGWELFVNRLKRSGYNLVVTGSNSGLLSKELATHLTGRHFAIELFPFSFKEYLLYKNYSFGEKDFYITGERAKIKNMLRDYLQYGGFPEAAKIEAKAQYLRELYDKIVTRDIILRYNIKYVRALKEMALYAFSNFASRMSYNKIRNIFEVKSVHTVKNYMDYLEEAYLLFQVNAFSFKLKEQLKRPKKFYCIDTGLINAIVARTTRDEGKLLENAVFLELKRRNKEVYFYSHPRYEVDFLVKDGLKVGQLIQASYSLGEETSRKREIKALLRASEELGCSDLTIITWDEEREEKISSKRIKCIPLWKWLVS